MGIIKGAISEAFERIADLFRPRAKIMINPSEVIVQREKAIYLDYKLQPGFERKTFYKAEEIEGDFLLTTERLTFISDQQLEYFNVFPEAVKEFTIISKNEIQLSIKKNDEEKKHSLRVSSPEKWRSNLQGIIHGRTGKYTFV